MIAETLSQTQLKTNQNDFWIRPSLPPVRKIFVPDPGYIIVDADLDGAEGRYVAWEAGGSFREAFERGLKIHVATMEKFFPDKFRIDPKHEPQYTKCKNMAYGTTFGGGPRGIASAASIPEPIVAAFQPWFFGQYPGISNWHNRTEMAIHRDRTISNPFGYRIRYFDRPSGLLPKALAWQSQSAIAIVTQRGEEIIQNEFPEVQVLLQVHDSLIFQVPQNRLELLRIVQTRLCNAPELRIPFPDPLQIPWSFKASRKSWGDALPLNTETMQVQSGPDLWRPL